jgi:hypothetical protein
VRFECHDDVEVVSCSAPVTVTAEGAGQVVTGTATDNANQTQTTTVTINIDKTMPALAVTSPANGATTTASTIAITATADDTLSGVADATCNGEPATVTSGAISCSVPLGNGRNFLAVQVSDVAGNKRSVLLRVNRMATATTLSALPTQLRLLPDEEHSIRLVDEFGQDAPSATWSVDDSAVAEVTLTAGGETVVTALASGTTTLTGTAGGLSATLDLTVAAGAAFVDGDSRWRIAGTPGYAVARLVPALGDEDGPTLYAVEGSTEGNAPVQLRALRNDGSQKWIGQLPINGIASYMKVLGDSSGGVVVNTGSTILQAGGATNWQYESPDWLNTRMAQGGDGTVFVVELQSDYSAPSSSLLALDGTTGDPKWRVALPSSWNGTLNMDCESWQPEYVYAAPAEIGTPSVDQDGNVWMQVRHSRYFLDYLPCGTGYAEREETLELLRVTPGGASTWVTLFHDSNSGPSQSTPVGVGTPDRTVVNDAGDILATWNYQNAYYYPAPEVHEARATYVAGATATTGSAQVIGNGSWDGQGLVAAENGQAFGYYSPLPYTGNANLVSLDLSSASALWTQGTLAWESLIASTAGGGYCRQQWGRRRIP